MNRPAAALRPQQQAFAAAVRTLADPGGLCRPAAPGVPARWDAYRDAYASRLVKALRDNFEVLARIMGDAAFDALAHAYLAAHPSGFRSIRWFGHRLPEFMQRAAEGGDGTVAHAAFVDLARMDWALRGAFDAADAATLQRTELAAVPAERWAALRFGLHPSVGLVALQWAVEPAWRAERERMDGADPAQGDLPPPLERPHDLLVWRQGLDVLWRSLPDDESRLLKALRDGADFGTLCAQAAEDGDPDAAAVTVVGLLQRWLDDGLLSNLG